MILMAVSLALVLGGLLGWPIVRPGAVSRRLARLTNSDAVSRAAADGRLPRPGGGGAVPRAGGDSGLPGAGGDGGLPRAGGGGGLPGAGGDGGLSGAGSGGGLSGAGSGGGLPRAGSDGGLARAGGDGGLTRAGGAAVGRSGRQNRTAFASRIPHVLVAAASGIGVAGLIGSWWAIPLGIAAGLGAYRFLRSREPAEVRAARLRAVADLPLGCDLLAAALKAGAPVDRAVIAVAEAIGGPLGERLGRVGRSLRLGADPPEAWGHLSEVTGADRVVAAAVRSSDSGGALAGALHRLADDLRADRAAAAGAAARRAGVLIVLPLGLCFLPAFILAGLVPVVVAVLDGVL